MVAYSKKNKAKSHLTSLIHGAVIGGYFLFIHQHSMAIMQSSNKLR